MQFDLSSDQKLLVEGVTRYCSEQVPLQKVRDALKDEAVAEKMWEGFLKLGLAGLVIPENAGGSNLALLDAAVISEVLGYYAVPDHFFNPVLAGMALREAPDDHTDLLSQIADGSLSVGTALSELAGSREDCGLNYQQDKLSGKTLFVRDGGCAEALLVCTTEKEVLWVDAVDQVEMQVLSTIDKTRKYTMAQFESVTARVIAKGDAGRKLTSRLLAAARVLTAADSLGAAQSMLDKAVEYALERKQFNRVIGSFQAVKHLCAEMAAELEPCRSLLWYTAHSHHSMPESFELLSCHLKAHLGEVSRFVARTAIEVHGGMGFTDLMGLHFWFKRIGLDRQLFGGPERIRAEAAELAGYC